MSCTLAIALPALAPLGAYDLLAAPHRWPEARERMRAAGDGRLVARVRAFPMPAHG